VQRCVQLSAGRIVVVVQALERVYADGFDFGYFAAAGHTGLEKT